jgi:hypothetical protein
LFRYLMLLLIGVAVVVINPAWFWVPFALWLLMLVARAIVSIWRNRNCSPGSFVRNVRRALMVIAILTVLDAAAIIGWLQWLFLDAFRGARKTPVEAG